MSVYLLVEVEIQDPELYERYIEEVPSVVFDHGGRYLSRTSNVIPLAGDWEPDQLIIVEFPDMDALVTFTTSAEYQRLARLREQATRIRALILTGIESQPAPPEPEPEPPASASESETSRPA